ncbi:MAG: flavin reductase [Bacilli bacterium]|jgi:flavin reductase (DIM6/NTAB) family NADH-FMN oxidoreductase RutF|nr:flavin reductase [Bacilli bacterium]
MEKEYQVNPFTRFHVDAALVTAGDKEKFNSMTIGWGTLGTLWSQDVMIVFVRDSRYTFQFMEKEENFTVSFYQDKSIHAVMGSLSGRDVDKVAKCNLHPVFTDNGITYEEAQETFFCKKLYVSKMDIKDLPEEVQKRHYSNKDTAPHYMFIGKIIDHKVK